MENLLNLTTYPLTRLQSPEGMALVTKCKAALAKDGMFTLDGFLRDEVILRAVAEVSPTLETAAHTHARTHNIYFKPDIPGLAPDHPALRECQTVNHTICADQLRGTIVSQLYEWPPFAAFLAAVMDKPQLYPMIDPLAPVNVMAYHEGEALNWHFDRSEFTTTLLLQAPKKGGEFIYRTDLRSDDDPNYDGVARLLNGEDEQAQQMTLSAGSLNVFKGKNTAHRVSPVEGARARIIAVFSYFERPGVEFTDAERLGFYGRTG
ncbi:MAG: HalD/BesD family halogenase [Pikeienuella sp.]